ncbi:universal stress protein [Vannielia sp.]|uniref:universal stress protein n=1 Tax=Vannielia sp. TaxID=2813045 RepID=UPI0026360D77|nr:universal stress protein [Vannielia sp.]MDF1871117.1 universal stress protein [Vannielia sp.]
MIKNVLCAVDIANPKAETKVLERAYKLAEMEGAQLDVITVIPDYGMSVVGGYFGSDHTAKAKAKAGELLKTLVAQTLGAEVNGKIRHVIGVGNAYHEILETAEKAGADLIVLGAHTPDIKDYLLGPNAARVVRHSTCSVYVVR